MGLKRLITQLRQKGTKLNIKFAFPGFPYLNSKTIVKNILSPWWIKGLNTGQNDEPEYSICKQLHKTFDLQIHLFIQCFPHLEAWASDRVVIVSTSLAVSEGALDT